MYALEIKHLFKSYLTRGKKVEVLQDISLQIGRGEMVAVMGASGSGKTTLLHNLSGIDVPDSGEILINGQELSTFSREELAMFRRRHFGMVFQDFQLLESLTVEENILLPMILDKRNQMEQDQQLRKMLDLTEIGELADMNRQTKASMMIVTHDMHVASFCHRILRLEDGGVADDIY